MLVGLGQASPLVTDFHEFHLPKIRDALSGSSSSGWVIFHFLLLDERLYNTWILGRSVNYFLSWKAQITNFSSQLIFNSRKYYTRFPRHLSACPCVQFVLKVLHIVVVVARVFFNAWFLFLLLLETSLAVFFFYSQFTWCIIFLFNVITGA